MKNVFYSLLVSLLIVSCQNENYSSNPTELLESNKIQLVEIDVNNHITLSRNKSDNGMDKIYALRFDSEATYKSILEKFEDMSKTERIEFISKYGLISLQEFAKIADDELENIGNSAKNESEFRARYNKYKEKYAGLLISNSYDTEDLQLYVPDGDELSTFLISKNKIIVIGDEVREISLSNDMSESDKSVFTPNISTLGANDVNGFQVKENKRKTTCSVGCNMVTRSVNVHVGCQKKMWYGWKNDNDRLLYYTIVLSNFKYCYKGQYGQAVWISCPDVYAFTKRQNSIDFFTGVIYPNSPSATGYLYVWTDYLTGPESVNYSHVVLNETIYGKQQLPKCDINKAYWCKLSFIKASKNEPI